MSLNAQRPAEKDCERYADEDASGFFVLVQSAIIFSCKDFFSLF